MTTVTEEQQMQIDLDALQKLCDEATPGPWCIESVGEKGDGSNMIGVAFDSDDKNCERQLSGWLPVCRPITCDFIEYYRDELVAECEHRNRNSGNDAAFIAAARTALPALIAKCREQEKEIDLRDGRVATLFAVQKALEAKLAAANERIKEATRLIEGCRKSLKRAPFELFKDIDVFLATKEQS